MKTSRRQILKSMLAVTAALTSVGLKTAAANEVGKFVVAVDIASPPLSRPKLFNALELMVGDPVKVMPKAAVLRKAVKTSLASMKAGMARRLLKVRRSRYQEWKAALEEIEYYPVEQQLELINDFINTAPYIRDGAGGKKRDYWQSPEVFLDQGGDCEDFAIAKLASLKAMGFNEERLRLVIVSNEARQEKHACLAVYLGGEVYILDNLLDRVVKQEKLSFYAPICSMTHNCLWMHWRKGEKRRGLS